MRSGSPYGAAGQGFLKSECMRGRDVLLFWQPGVGCVIDGRRAQLPVELFRVEAGSVTGNLRGIGEALVVADVEHGETNAPEDGGEAYRGNGSHAHQSGEAGRRAEPLREQIKA